MKKIRAAILGYGRSGSTMHAGAIAANPNDFQMVAVCDTDPARRQQARERFGCAVYEDYHEMLRKENLDLVSVVTRSDQHCAMTCDCLEAGVNVLVTKPWAVDTAQAERMVAAQKRTGNMLLPWLPARWGCDLKRLREMVGEGVIGKVFLIRRCVASFGTRCDWQTETKYGGGYVLNWGPHIIDPPVLLAGSPVKSVFGRLRKAINPGDAEDLFLAVLTLADGTIVHGEYTVSVEEMPSWVVQGDRGTIVVRGKSVKALRNTPRRPDDPTKFSTMQADATQVAEETLSGATYGDEKVIYAEAAAALRREKPFPVTPEHALQLSRVLQAVKDSDAKDAVIHLEGATS